MRRGIFNNFTLVEASLLPHLFIAEQIKRNKNKIIAVFGPSGGGKTIFSKLLLQALGSDHVALISVDDYWRYTREEMKTRGITGYDWEARDKKTFLKHLKKLRQGESIQKPVYDYIYELPTGKTEKVVPKDIILLEGTLDFTDIADCIIFIYAPDKILIKRRLKRDKSIKLSSVIGNLEEYLKNISIPAYKKRLLPLVHSVDFILDTYSNKLYKRKSS